MKRVLVFTATYNEADNVVSLVREVFASLPQCDMLVVDDNSPDGTGRILDELRTQNSRLLVIHRSGKNGLGSAHKLAIQYAIAQGYDALITMDADFSHDPKYLPQMLRELESADFVIGSRYAPGGSCEYPPSRVALSRTANTLTRTLLGIPLRETTTSYRGFRRSLLERMNVDSIHADGYSYFVESLYQISCIARSNGEHRMAEFPIRFVDRRAGSTKISKREIWRGFTTLARLAASRAMHAGQDLPPVPGAIAPAGATPCTVCGCSYQVEEYPASNTGHASATYNCTSTAHASHGRIVQCLGCGLVFTNPQLRGEEVLSLYSQVEDKTYLENTDARVQTFTYNLDAIRDFLPKSGRMLDVGSYCGIFLKIARDRGYDVTGVEPSVWASSYARETLQIPTFTGNIRSLPQSAPFDVICSWDVLEHVSDPLAELARINERLRMGGTFAFSTLDYGNWYPRLMGERWPWMMDMHLYYFDQKVTKWMLEKSGFRLIHAQNYCHIITLEYFLRKLDALGIPGADAVRSAVHKTPLRGIYIPFRFGDIRLFVCEKVRDVAEAETQTSPAVARAP
jgi:dolichol-phosphate mannosyltransferase